MLDKNIFDRELPFEEFIDVAPELKEKVVQLCTVRQAEMPDLSLGTLFWLLKAAQATQASAKVEITDFYDKAGSDNTGVRDVISLLGLQSIVAIKKN